MEYHSSGSSLALNNLKIDAKILEQYYYQQKKII
jgi:hypothetical protein